MACDVRETVGSGTVLQYLYDLGDLERESDLLSDNEGRRFWLRDYVHLLRKVGASAVGAFRTKGNRWWVATLNSNTPHLYAQPFITLISRDWKEGTIHLRPLVNWCLELQGKTHEAGGTFDV